MSTSSADPRLSLLAAELHPCYGACPTPCPQRERAQLDAARLLERLDTLSPAPISEHRRYAQMLEKLEAEAAFSSACWPPFRIAFDTALRVVRDHAPTAHV